MIDKIVEGKIQAFYKDVALMHQAWVREPKKTIGDLVKETSAKTGENIQVRRFVRYQLGARSERTRQRGDPSDGYRSDLKYPRVLLKLSGEALAGDKGFGYDFDTVEPARRRGRCRRGRPAPRVGLVIGGGNIVRGSQLSKTGMDRVAADYMGMLGTVINALAVQDVLERKGHRHARHDGDPHGGDRRAVHPPARHPPPREGPRRHLRRRHRQSVLLHRHRRGAARDPDQGQRHHQGDERRRRVLRRSEAAIRTPSSTTRSASAT